MSNKKIAGRTLNNWILTFESTLEEMEPFRDLSAWEESKPLIQYLQRENILPSGPLPVRNFEEFRFYGSVLREYVPHSASCDKAGLTEFAFEGGDQFGKLMEELVERVFEKLGVDIKQLPDNGYAIWQDVMKEYLHSDLIKDQKRDISHLLISDEGVQLEERVEMILRGPVPYNTQYSNEDAGCTLWYGGETGTIYGLGPQTPFWNSKSPEEMKSVVLICHGRLLPKLHSSGYKTAYLESIISSMKKKDFKVLRKVLGQIKAYDAKFSKQTEEKASENRVKKSKRRLMLAGLGLGLATIVGGLTCASSKAPSKDIIKYSHENGAYNK